MGWMDEGFRSVRNSLYDVKEELNFRIIQTSSDGKETLLYYGCMLLYLNLEKYLISLGLYKT